MFLTHDGIGEQVQQCSSVSIMNATVSFETVGNFLRNWVRASYKRKLSSHSLPSITTTNYNFIQNFKKLYLEFI